VDKNFIYGRIYAEIKNGYSKIDIPQKTLYFKHSSVAEYFHIYSNYDNILLEAKRRGLSTEEEQLEYAISEGWWTKEKESKINSLRNTVQNLIKTKNNLVLPSQKSSIDEQIKKTESILITFTKERKEIISYTAEEYANERFLDEMVMALTYEDQDLLIKAFQKQDDYFNLSDKEVETVREVYNKNLFLFSSRNLKYIGASGFFQNLVYLNDDANGFWGVPVSKCTKYQVDLLLYGKMYKNLIKSYAENGEQISEEILNDSEKFIEWVENKSTIDSGKQVKRKKSRSEGKNVVSSYVGASKEDLEKLGVKIDKLKGKSLLELAQEKGGVLEQSDYLKARENN
jgi:hypothetical protein